MIYGAKAARHLVTNAQALHHENLILAKFISSENRIEVLLTLKNLSIGMDN